MMSAISKIGILASLLLVSAAPTAHSQTQAPTSASKWTTEKLVGEYYFGDGLGVNCTLKLSQNNEFKFRWTGCGGEYGRNSGSFHLEDDVLVLEPTQDSPMGISGTKTHFHPVPWGKRFYLIATEDMTKFCRDVALGWDGRGALGAIHGDHYVRLDPRNDRDLPPVTGKPNVPDKYKSILDAGVWVRVTGASQSVVVIDKGREAGLQEGTILYAPSYALPWLKVVKVSERTAEVEVIDKHCPAPKVGERFTAFIPRSKA